MFRGFKNLTTGVAGKLQAVCKSILINQFEFDIKSPAANANFCRAIDCFCGRIFGKIRRLFVELKLLSVRDFREFWDRQSKGRRETGECCRVGCGGREVWSQASCSGVRDGASKTIRVIRIAAYIIERKQQQAEQAAGLDALGRVQVVIDSGRARE